ncbi:MAG: hypothetical protein AB9891_04570 [Anaerolineaceae bacterium]
MHRKHNAAVFLLLCFLLVLVGGGIGQIIFFTLVWLAANRIHSPLSWWKKVLPERSRTGMSRIWPVTLAVGIGLFLIALEIAIFGALPGVADPEQRLYICWSALIISLVCFMVSFVSGFSRDIIMRKVK